MKPFFSSKTNWLGIAVATLPFWEEIVAAGNVSAYPYVFQAIGILIIVLRSVTKTPVASPFTTKDS